MDIQAEKLDLIKWLADVTDTKIIEQFKILQKSNLKKSEYKLSKAEKKAINKGLISIEKGHVKSNEEVKRLTKEKYTQLLD